jgi:hypothetical protein
MGKNTLFYYTLKNMKKNLTIAGMSFNKFEKDEILVAIFDKFIREFECKQKILKSFSKINKYTN